MIFSVNTPVLEAVACFSHLAAIRTPLQVPAAVLTPASVRPDLVLPAAALASWRPVFEPDPKLAGLQCVRRLPYAQRQLLWRTLFLLQPHDIKPFVEESLPFGLQLSLRRGRADGLIVIYHKGTGAWSKVVGAGRRSALTNEAVRILGRPLPRLAHEVVNPLPETAPLALVSVYCLLADWASRQGWGLPWLNLGSSTFEMWMQDSAGTLAHLALAYGPADAPLRVTALSCQSQALQDSLRPVLLGLSHP